MIEWGEVQRERPMLLGCPIHAGLSVFEAQCCDREIRPGPVHAALLRTRTFQICMTK
jgi:hypothetical protein